jgi:hypothetical protein
MQCCDAIAFARVLVLASHRRTKMLVRGQADACEIIVGMARADFGTTGFF